MATEAPEGIVFSSDGTTFIDYNDKYGNNYSTTEILGLSKSQIETLDLISEGPVQGPISGTYLATGQLGEVGWRSVIFSGFNTPVGYNDSKFLRSIYWNEVPVLSDNALFNFQNINVKHTIGKPNGEVIQVLSPFQTVSRSIGERLRAGSTNAKVYRIFNKDCRGVVINVKFPSLAEYNDVGDIGRLRIDYSISYKPIYSNKYVENYTIGKNEVVFGKILASNGYIRTTRVDFSSNFLNDSEFAGWELRIERTTPESTTSLIVNQTYIESITEIQGNIYTFPNSAMVRSLFDAEYFNSVPERAFDYQLLKVKIPGNYDPLYKTYNTTGFATTNSGWNGEFATGKHWTDNPAWCYYDLLTNKRYGLGKYIDSELVDKTSLYEIGRYCDTLVNDGYGGLEPRFTCNVWITSREEAYKVVNDMASVFRGLTYYSNGLIYATQDSPKNEILTFTNANVEDGNFEYSTSSRKTRNSIAIVRYNDPRNFYKPAIEYVEDFDAIRKYGLRETELTAFGCSSRGQAIRLGRWALLTDKLEPELVTFTAGIGEAVYIKPGDVFKIHDANRKTKRYGGRTVQVKNIDGTGSDVILDYKIDTEPTVEYKISFLTPSFNYDPSQVSGLNSNDFQNIRKSFLQNFYFSGFQSTQSGTRTVLNLYSGFNYSDYFVTGNQIWMMELSDRYSSYTGSRYFSNTSYDYYRTINIVEKEPHKFEIVGLQYNPQKYIEIESGLLFQRDVTNQIKIPATPYNLSLNVYNTSANQKTITYSFLVDDLKNIDSFKVYAKNGDFPNSNVPDQNYLINTLPSYLNYGEWSPTQTGTYYFRVYSSNDSQGIVSTSAATSNTTIYSFDPIRDVIISSLQIVNITGVYSGNAVNNYVTVLTDNDASPQFTWQVGSNNSFVTTGNLQYRATVRPYGDGLSRIPSPDVVYQETGISETNWTFSLNSNIVSSGGPYREYQVVIEAHDEAGRTSAGNQINGNENGWSNFSNGYDILSIENPRQTGIEMSLNIPTQPFLSTGFYKHTGQHKSFQYMNDNGDVSVDFTSGTFDADLVGGFIYVSSGRFPKLETQLRSGEWATAVTKLRFDFDPLNPRVFVQNIAYNIRSLPFGYMSLSFYDAIDEALLDGNVNISTGLYLSDNAVLEKSITENGDASIVVGQITGTATGLGDPLILSNLAPGTHVIGFSTGGFYTNVVYVNAGYTTNVISGRIATSPYLPTITGAWLYLNTYIDDSLFVSVNNQPIKDDGNGFGDDVLAFDIYSGAVSGNIYLKRGDLIKIKGRDNFGQPRTIETWTGRVFYSDGVVENYYGGSTQSFNGNWGLPFYTDNGYFIIGQQSYPTN